MSKEMEVLELFENCLDNQIWDVECDIKELIKNIRTDIEKDDVDVVSVSENSEDLQIFQAIYNALTQTRGLLECCKKRLDGKYE